MDDGAQQRAEMVKRMAREVGFDLVGIARAGASAYGEAYRRWIAEGRQGEMDYLARNIEERLDITKKFPWARSVVCVAMAHWQDVPAARHGDTEARREEMKIARYAWGRDYHKVIEGRLKNLERAVRAAAGAGFEARRYCDTGPILEREFAALAGLGWIGKNTLLIHPRHGSWFVLGEWVTSLELAADSPIGSHCGTCTRCIEACPTGGIVPWSVDATKCISYLTIEHRGEIDAGLRGAMREAGYVVGCDICQEVCPFNREPLGIGAGNAQDFAVKSPAPSVAVDEVRNWEEQGWDIVTRGRAFRRVKLEMWKRNAGIVGNDE